ncbi:unnamed protein product [Linum trigynum]
MLCSIIRFDIHPEWCYIEAPCTNLHVSSEVPEGKGVSSSASVEVASISAIAAAHGLSISPRDIALLSQKVSYYAFSAKSICGAVVAIGGMSVYTSLNLKETKKEKKMLPLSKPKTELEPTP